MLDVRVQRPFGQILTSIRNIDIELVITPILPRLNQRPIPSVLTNEPRHEISNNVVCATSKASDQPAHTRSLIRVFACRLDILSLLGYWPNIIWRT